MTHTPIRQPNPDNYPEPSNLPCLYCAGDDNVHEYITEGGLVGQAWIPICNACAARVARKRAEAENE